MVSYLRPGSSFTGTQQSGRSSYEVTVQIHSINIPTARLNGTLSIANLTAENPFLTTFFEGEIIDGNEYRFATGDRWGASEKIDMQHWSRFASFRAMKKAIKRDLTIDLGHWSTRAHVYMRWKECFLYHEPNVEHIDGASFAGFYYICFEQGTGVLSGLYYHQNSEMFQQLGNCRT
ncbi:hypothetical protein YB2330_001221 [Saitoella coloradoensis]